MSDQAPFEQRLAQGWRALSPPDDLKERVRARMLAAPLTGAAAPRNASPGGAAEIQHTGVRLTSSRWRALRASGRVGAGVGAVLVGLGFFAGRWSSRSAEMQERHAPVAVPQVVDRSETAVQESASTVAPARTSSATTETGAAAALHRSGRRVHAEAIVTPALAELELLQRAERALRARQAGLALALTREIRSRFPRSELHEEREAMELMTHCQLQDRQSDAARRRFSQRYPSSVYLDRIRAECDSKSVAPALTNPEAPDMDE